MKQGITLLLKIAVFLIGITVFALCTIWLPWQANEAAEIVPEFAYLKYPVLIGLYATAIPFFFALNQALKLLNYIDHNSVFSELSVRALKYIKYCGFAISVLYMIGSAFLISQSALHPGVALIGLTIIFASVVIAIFSAVLQNLLRRAIDIKSENELTV